MSKSRIRVSAISNGIHCRLVYHVERREPAQEIEAMIATMAGMYMIGLFLFLLLSTDPGSHYERFKKTGERPFRYGGYDNKYPLWQNIAGLVSIALLVIGSSGLALLMLAPTMYEVITDPDGE